METPSEGSTPKKHARHGSGRVPMVRRSTKGPLDLDDSPLVDPLSPSSSVFLTPSQTPQLGSQLLSPTSISATQSQFAPAPHRTGSPRLPPSRHGTPRLSPQPSTLSNATFRTAHSTLTAQTSSIYHSQKDFSHLLRPDLYHPLTHLSTPPPFRTSSSLPTATTPLPTLLATGHYRAAAIAAASTLTSTVARISPSDHVQILDLFYIRLASLTLCNATPLAAQEVKALEDLNAAYYRDDATGDHLAPWELRVLAVRLQGMGFSDARRGVMGYYELAREVRTSLSALKKEKNMKVKGETPTSPTMSGATSEEEIEDESKLLEARLQDLGLRVASALVEMDDLEGAARHLRSLPATPELNTQKALLYLYLGDVDAARDCVSSVTSADTKQTKTDNDHDDGDDENGDGDDTESVEKDNETATKIILALAHMGDADYAAAITAWEDILSHTALTAPEYPMLSQNLAVCNLYLGNLDSARTSLTSLINSGHNFHALTFNLCTVYELCSERSRAMKIGLAERVAEGLAGEGSKGGWEKSNADFKL